MLCVGVVVVTLTLLALCITAKQVPTVTGYHAACEAREQEERQKRYDGFIHTFTWMAENRVFEEGKMYTLRALDSDAQNEALAQQLRQSGWNVSWHRFAVRSAAWTWGRSIYDGGWLCRILRTNDTEDAPESYRSVINPDYGPFSRDTMYVDQPSTPWHCPACAAWCIPDWTVAVIKVYVPERPRVALAVVGTRFITSDRTVVLSGERSVGTRFAWRQIQGREVQLVGVDTLVPQFDAPCPGFYTFELTVYAGETKDSAVIEVWVTL